MRFFRIKLYKAVHDFFVRFVHYVIEHGWIKVRVEARNFLAQGFALIIYSLIVATCRS